MRNITRHYKTSKRKKKERKGKKNDENISQRGKTLS